MIFNYEHVICIDAYDADTITVIIDHGATIKQELRVRLARIDAPEVRGDEREQGTKARNYMRIRILNKPIKLKSLKFEKYGRLLCEVYDEEGNNINDELVSNGYAKYRTY
jgi:micrococcal nuclease